MEPWFESSFQNYFRDRAISDTQLPPASPRNTHFLSVNNKTIVGAGDFGGRPEKLKLADNKYESQLNALRLEEMFKNVFNGATHQDIINLKAEKYTQDKVRTPFSPRNKIVILPYHGPKIMVHIIWTPNEP